MKAAENMGQFSLRNAQPGVAYREHDVVTAPRQRDGDRTGQGKFERIREQIQYNLPHHDRPELVGAAVGSQPAIVGRHVQW